MDSSSEMNQTESIFSFPSLSTSPQQSPDLHSQEPQTMTITLEDLAEKPLTTIDSAGAEYRRLSGGDEGEEDGLEEFRRENAQQFQEKISAKIRSSKASFEAAPHVAALTEYLMSLPIKELNYGKAGDITDTRAKDIITKNVKDHIEALSQALMEDSMSNAKCGAPIEDDLFDDDCWLLEPEPPKRRTHSYSQPTTLETLYEDEEFDPLLPKRRSTWVCPSLLQYMTYRLLTYCRLRVNVTADLLRHHPNNGDLQISLQTSFPKQPTSHFHLLSLSQPAVQLLDQQVVAPSNLSQKRIWLRLSILPSRYPAAPPQETDHLHTVLLHRKALISHRMALLTDRVRHSHPSLTGTLPQMTTLAVLLQRSLTLH